MNIRSFLLLHVLFLLASFPIASLVPSASVLAAESEERYAFSETFVFRLSAYQIEQADTKVSVASSQGAGVGTGISFARDLGGDESLTIPRIDMYYRFNERHRIEFSNFEIERDGRRVITLELDVEDETFEIGETIVSEITYELFRIGYAYSFYHSEQVELSLSTGLNFATYEFDISNSDGSSSSESDVTAPLPMFGLSAAYAITPSWSIHYLSETFFIEIDDALEGALLNYELNLQYRFLDSFIVGAGITRVSTDLEASSDDWKGRINDSHRGFLFFLSYYI